MVSKLATWLNEQSEERRLSLREIAERAGVSHTTIIRIANNKLKTRPSADVCFGIARALSVPPQRVFRYAGYPEMTPHIIGGDDQDRKRELLDYYEGLDEHGRRTMIALAETLYEQRAPYAVEIRPNEEENENG
jgi:transcriptional regulator with XRE-family HTH domain